ncbi:MAG: hypothetical protein AAGD86_00425 [Pseudomonadota bacterium]
MCKRWLYGFLTATALYGSILEPRRWPLETAAEPADVITVSGLVRGMSTAFVVCRNLTTGGAVTERLAEEGTWNCGESGLSIRRDDVVRVLIGGGAQPD